MSASTSSCAAWLITAATPSSKPWAGFCSRPNALPGVSAPARASSRSRVCGCLGPGIFPLTRSRRQWPDGAVAFLTKRHRARTKTSQRPRPPRPHLQRPLPSRVRAFARLRRQRPWSSDRAHPPPTAECRFAARAAERSSPSHFQPQIVRARALQGQFPPLWMALITSRRASSFPTMMILWLSLVSMT